MRSETLRRKSKTIIQWLQNSLRIPRTGDGDLTLPCSVDDLLTFTPEVSSRIETFLETTVYANLASKERISDEQLSVLAQEAIDSLSDSLQTQLASDTDTLLKDDRVDIAGFRRRLNQRWETPLDLLELFVALAFDAGLVSPTSIVTFDPMQPSKMTWHLKHSPGCTHGRARLLQKS